MRLVPALILSFLLLNGCDRLNQIAQQSEVVQKQGEELKVITGKIDGMEKRLSDLQSSYDEMKSHCNELEQNLFDLRSQHDNEIVGLQSKCSWIEFLMNVNKSIVFNATSKGYHKLDTDLGCFLVSVQGTIPYLNGHKLSLNIGNPSTSEFAGFTLKAKWGEAFDPKGRVTYADWKKSLKSKEETFTEHLKAGHWNKIDLVLAPAKPEQLEYIEIEMEVNQVLLITDRESR